MKGMKISNLVFDYFDKFYYSYQKVILKRFIHKTEKSWTKQSWSFHKCLFFWFCSCWYREINLEKVKRAILLIVADWQKCNYLAVTRSFALLKEVTSKQNGIIKIFIAWTIYVHFEPKTNLIPINIFPTTIIFYQTVLPTENKMLKYNHGTK